MVHSTALVVHGYYGLSELLLDNDCMHQATCFKNHSKSPRFHCFHRIYTFLWSLCCSKKGCQNNCNAYNLASYLSTEIVQFFQLFTPLFNIFTTYGEKFLKPLDFEGFCDIAEPLFWSQNQRPNHQIPRLIAESGNTEFSSPTGRKFNDPRQNFAVCTASPLYPLENIEKPYYLAQRISCHIRATQHENLSLRRLVMALP